MVETAVAVACAHVYVYTYNASFLHIYFTCMSCWHFDDNKHVDEGRVKITFNELNDT